VGVDKKHGSLVRGVLSAFLGMFDPANICGAMPPTARTLFPSADLFSGHPAERRRLSFDVHIVVLPIVCGRFLGIVRNFNGPVQVRGPISEHRGQLGRQPGLPVRQERVGCDRDNIYLLCKNNVL